MMSHVVQCMPCVAVDACSIMCVRAARMRLRFALEASVSAPSL